MDEFSRVVDEFSGSNDEFNQRVLTTKLKEQKPVKNEKKKLKKMVQLVCSTAVTVTMVATNLLAKGYNHFSLFGDAFVGPKEEIQLVDYRTNSGGAIVSGVPISATEDIEVEFDFWLGEKDGGNHYGDGISVSFMKEAFDLTDNPDYYNSSNGQWLFYNGDFGAEIDIFNNYSDPDNNHLAIIGDNTEEHYVTYSPEEIICYKVHHFKVQYSYPSMKVYYDYQLVLEYEGLPVSKSDSLYLMIGSATGANYAGTYIHNGYVNGEKIVIDNRDHNKNNPLAIAVDWSEAPLPTLDINDSLNHLITPDDITEPDDIVEPDESDHVPGSYDYLLDDLCYSCYSTGLCLTCHWTGYVQCTDLSRSCQICHGRGLMVCPDCNHTAICQKCWGRTDRAYFELGIVVGCEECQGTGVICHGSAQADDPNGCGGRGVSDCQNCNGRGMTDEGICPWCDGTLQHLCPSFEFHKDCENCDGKGWIVNEDL